MLRHTRQAVEIVIARYHEDVQWAENWPATIYNKGARLDTPSVQRFLPNVGRESQTYLHHIVNCWDDLAEVTLFTQGGIREHLGPDIGIDQFFAGDAEIVVPGLLRAREWGPDGRIQYPGAWKAIYESGRIKRATLSLVEWFRQYLALDLNALGTVVYSPGAVFSVKRACIHRRPREFYIDLLRTVDHHSDPEEGHYVERSWIYVFGKPQAQVRCLHGHPA